MIRQPLQRPKKSAAMHLSETSLYTDINQLLPRQSAPSSISNHAYGQTTNTDRYRQPHQFVTWDPSCVFGSGPSQVQFQPQNFTAVFPVESQTQAAVQPLEQIRLGEEEQHISTGLTYENHTSSNFRLDSVSAQSDNSIWNIPSMPTNVYESFQRIVDVTHSPENNLGVTADVLRVHQRPTATPMEVSNVLQSQTRSLVMQAAAKATSDHLTSHAVVRRSRGLGHNRPAIIPGCSTFKTSHEKGSKKRRFSTEAKRVETAETRHNGTACPRCKEKKIRCVLNKNDPSLPCEACELFMRRELVENPCDNLMTLKLFREGTSQKPKIFLRWKELKQLAGCLDVSLDVFLDLENGISISNKIFPGPRKVFLTQDITQLRCCSVEISPFIPTDQDATSFDCVDPSSGTKRPHDMPAYYISNMGDSIEEMKAFISDPKSRREYYHLLLSERSAIARNVFDAAEAYAATSKNDLITESLKFWVAMRMIERTWLICGEDLLGLSPMMGNIGPCRMNPWQDAIPATPMMDTQLDEHVIKEILEPLGKRVLRLLNKAFDTKEKDRWFEAFLAAFILVNSANQAISDEADFAKRCGLPKRNSSNRGPTLSEAYVHSCRVILSHFHRRTRGANPFSVDWLNRQQEPARVSGHQNSLIRSSLNSGL
ncbi:hypothetical protein Q7P37_006979 [Cladosporium fusiforme]